MLFSYVMSDSNYIYFESFSQPDSFHKYQHYKTLYEKTENNVIDFNKDPTNILQFYI